MISIEHLIDRVKLVILTPKEAWTQISTEQIEIKSFLLSFVMPLVLIPTIASFIGYGLIGVGSYFKLASFSWGVHHAILTFIGGFLSVLIGAFCIHKLAPTFNTEVSLQDAVKLVGYSYTPVWLAGVFYMIPSLAVLGLVAGIYSLYVLYFGFVPITNVSEDKKTNYFILSLILVIAVSAVVSIVLGIILSTIGLHTY